MNKDNIKWNKNSKKRRKWSFLYKHPNIHYILYCIRRFGNKSYYETLFRKNIKDIYPSYFIIEKFGIKNKDKIFLHIDVQLPHCGISAYFRYTLIDLYVSEELGFIPVIEWSGDSWLKEEKSINGTNNIYEYYFQEPTTFGIKDLYESFHVFSTKDNIDLHFIGDYDLGGTSDRTILAAYDVSEEYIQKLGTICRKYIKLNPTVESVMNKGFSKIFGSPYNISNTKKQNRVLGIHIRGTDYALNWHNHPTMVKPEQYKTLIDEAFNTGLFDKAFIATDDLNFLHWFIDIYGEKVIYYKDVFRGTGDFNIAGESQQRENAHYLSGLEPLRDIYTLAYCDGLISGLSGVPLCARIINRSIYKKYLFEKTISNGIYHL